MMSGASTAAAQTTALPYAIMIAHDADGRDPVRNSSLMALLMLACSLHYLIIHGLLVFGVRSVFVYGGRGCIYLYDY